ncbi:MAG: GNAT family N-acetyltransferase [Devosia sp.]
MPFTAALAPRCRVLMDEVYAETYPDDWSFDEWWAWVIGSDEYAPDLMLVAAVGDRLVGFCHGWSRPFIKDLVVARDWRGCGLGSALLTTQLETYAAAGAEFVDLKTDVVNTTAQSLYRRLGFVVIERVEPTPS